MGKRTILGLEDAIMPMKIRIEDLMRERYGDEANWPSQLQLVEMTGIKSTATVSAWIKGRVDRFELDTLAKWCKFFGVQADRIFEYTEDEPA